MQRWAHLFFLQRALLIFFGPFPPRHLLLYSVQCRCSIFPLEFKFNQKSNRRPSVDQPSNALTDG